MKKLLYLLLFIQAVSCSKSGGGNGGGNVQEPAITFNTDANATNTSLSSNFPVTITLTSAMPSSSGINISSTVIDQSNNATIAQNAAINSTTAINNIQLINLPRQHWCTVTVKVTSVATPSNSATRTFNVAYK